MRKAFNIMRNRAHTDGTSSKKFWCDHSKLRWRGWVPEQGGWQLNPLPASQIVTWNASQLGPGNYYRLQEEAQALNLTLTMRQRIRDSGKLYTMPWNL